MSSNITVIYLNLIKKQRNQLLNDSDKYMISDFPITSNNLILIQEYRKDLRDYMDLSEVINYDYSCNIPLPDFPQCPF